jgi:hypothetical protein
VDDKTHIPAHIPFLYKILALAKRPDLQVFRDEVLLSTFCEISLIFDFIGSTVKSAGYCKRSTFAVV